MGQTYEDLNKRGTDIRRTGQMYRQTWDSTNLGQDKQGTRTNVGRDKRRRRTNVER